MRNKERKNGDAKKDYDDENLLDEDEEVKKEAEEVKKEGEEEKKDGSVVAADS
jgi:23S rRNA maturation-related 3'-5' exoribonuclease YhaM